jgi:hypothetical protein
LTGGPVVLASVPAPKRERPQLPTGYISKAPKGDVKQFNTSAARFTFA